MLDRRTRLRQITVLLAMDLFVLQRLHERFTGGIVIWISFAAHTDRDAPAFQQVRVVLGSILNAAVRMMHQAWSWNASFQRHAEGCDRQLVFHGSIQRPT